MITTRWSDVACTKIISGEKINPTMDATRPTFTTYCSKPLVTTTAVKQVVSSQQSAVSRPDRGHEATGPSLAQLMPFREYIVMNVDEYKQSSTKIIPPGCQHNCCCAIVLLASACHIIS
jgi:hypothetical protein